MFIIGQYPVSSVEMLFHYRQKVLLRLFVMPLLSQHNMLVVVTRPVVVAPRDAVAQEDALDQAVLMI
jgi:hypothetical protein